MIKKIDQDAFGKKGTCYTACMAMVLGLEFEEVPRFADLYNGDITLWNKLIDDFLESKGFVRLWYFEDQFEEVYEWMDNFDDFYFIMVGDVKRSNRNHGVVYNKRLPFHDPNPCREFLIKEKEMHIFLRKDGV